MARIPSSIRNRIQSAADTKYQLAMPKRYKGSLEDFKKDVKAGKYKIQTITGHGTGDRTRIRAVKQNGTSGKSGG